MAVEITETTFAQQYATVRFLRGVRKTLPSKFLPVNVFLKACLTTLFTVHLPTFLTNISSGTFNFRSNDYYWTVRALVEEFLEIGRFPARQCSHGPVHSFQVLDWIVPACLRELSTPIILTQFTRFALMSLTSTQLAWSQDFSVDLSEVHLRLEQLFSLEISPHNLCLTSTAESV